MKISNINKFKVLEPQVLTLVFNDNEPGDTTTDELYVQFDSDCDITAKGYSADNISVNMDFACINSLTTTSIASAPGVYLLLTGSLEKVELSVTPEITSEGYTPVNLIVKSLF